MEFDNPSIEDQNALLDLLKIDYGVDNFVGSYVGNGSVGGTPFIYFGFKATKVFIKNTDVVEDWKTYEPSTSLSFSNPILFNGIKIPAEMNKAGNHYTLIGVSLI